MTAERPTAEAYAVARREIEQRLSAALGSRRHGSPARAGAQAGGEVPACGGDLAAERPPSLPAARRVRRDLAGKRREAPLALTWIRSSARGSQPSARGATASPTRWASIAAAPSPVRGASMPETGRSQEPTRRLDRSSAIREAAWPGWHNAGGASRDGSAWRAPVTPRLEAPIVCEVLGDLASDDQDFGGDSEPNVAPKTQRATARAVTRWFAWLQGLDLNQRPLGHERNVSREASLDQPTNT
jgi:hypothetical protein